MIFYGVYFSQVCFLYFFLFYYSGLFFCLLMCFLKRESRVGIGGDGWEELKEGKPYSDILNEKNIFKENKGL